VATPIAIIVRTVSALNAREHFGARATRVRRERAATARALKDARAVRPAIPCSVLLTRISSSAQGLDDDNLVSAMKGIRDELSKWLGIDDRNSFQVRFRYAQRKGHAHMVLVEFGEPVSGAQFEIEGARVWPFPEARA
jgi:hypothetical protein